MKFSETKKFAKQIKSILNEKQLFALKVELTETPEKGDLIRDSGGQRKIRVRLHNTGKSGGARVIYYLQTEDHIILLRIYKKAHQENLTKAEISQIKKELGIS